MTRMKHVPLPSAEFLNDRYVYDPITGRLTWRFGTWNQRRKPGDPAGRISVGRYWECKINGRMFKTHRIIWRMVTGEDPGCLQIDHINGNSSDNRWDNLRVATVHQNAFNSRTYRARSSGLPKGVVARNGKYRARIGNGGAIDLGTFDTLEQAHSAYLRAAKAVCGVYANVRDQPTSYMLPPEFTTTCPERIAP
jgi:hypothetical protein